MRDDFPVPVKELLAKRVAYRCSNPGCRKVTSGPQEDPSKAINVGVACHITAASPGGPRYSRELTKETRTSIENGIWLCQTCGKLIDSDEIRYTISVLQDWKNKAEQDTLRALEKAGTLDDFRAGAFSRIERLMPKLLHEMRNDLAGSPLCREFVALKKAWLFNYPDREMFTYYYEDHESLEGKLRILENLGMIRDIQFNDVRRFVMEECLVDYLEGTR